MRSLKWFALILLTAMALASPAGAQALPGGFVDLRAIDPSILQDIRYAGSNNFVGRRLEGYDASECVVKRDVGIALKRVQQELAPQKLSLKMLDCYRPERAVHDMMVWARNGRETPAERRYHPGFGKADLFRLGYIAEHSQRVLRYRPTIRPHSIPAGPMPIARLQRRPARRKAASTWGPAMIVPTRRRIPQRDPSRRRNSAGATC
jgi:D-alanyl-D-alanine dipeptidase